jgi:hypothetical protein
MRSPLRFASLGVGSAVMMLTLSARGVLPSEQLQDYAANNLEHLLGPLNGGALPRPELFRLETDYQARLAHAAPQEKEMLTAALKVCNAFEQITNAREQAVARITGGKADNSDSQKSTKLHSDKDNYALDARRQEIRQGQSQSKFIITSSQIAADQQWQQYARPWRAEVQKLLVLEKQAELKLAAAAPAPATPPSPAPAPAAPPSPAPAPAAPPSPAAATAEADPVVGNWVLDSGGPLVLLPDHTITGRHGTWTFKGADASGRHYELHWPPPKNWSDYVTLSNDAKTLSGHTRGNKPINVYRQ